MAPANTPAPGGPPDQTKSNGSLWESVDGGRTWLDKSVGNAKTVDTSGADIISLAVNPFDANIAYAGLRGAGILKTEDGGQTWTYLPFQSQKVYGLGLDPIDPKIIYASGVWQNRGKIFKSQDSGQTWTEIYTSPSTGPLVVSLAVDQKNGNNIFAATSDNQVLETTDGGGSWKNVFVAPGPIVRIVFDGASNNLLYLVSLGQGVFRSTNGGQSFEDISKRIASVAKNNQDITVLKTDPNNANWVYAAGGAGILRSKNAGKDWEMIETLNDPAKFPVKALAINSKNSSEIIYGAAQATYKSLDGGTNWTTAQFEISRTINALEYGINNANILYLGLSK